MTVTGILTAENGNHFIKSENGQRHFEDRLIWDGYIQHWKGQLVCAREVTQKDYTTGQPIILMWPHQPKPETPYVEIYYNERLVKYPASTFGHNAINVNGEFFNFSHLLNENETMDEGEFMYRPALGEFAPSPRTGAFEIMEDGTSYYDKFGRNFMRSIDVIYIEGLDTKKLSGIFHDTLNRIHRTPTDPDAPEKYRDFNFIRNSCTTMIRDGLRRYGFNALNGILPRDFFVAAAWVMTQAKEKMNLRVRLYTRPQLKVDEAEFSKQTPLVNPKNRVKNYRLSKMLSS